MNATITFFAFVLIMGNLLSWALEGEQPYRDTHLVSGIAAADTLIPVDSVTGFLDSDFIYIEGEIIAYSGVATGAGNCGAGVPACFNLDDVTGRGVRGTEAALHGDHTRVYSRALGPLNQAKAFTTKHVGVFNVGITIPWINVGAVTNFVTKSIQWDFIFLQGAFETVRLILEAVSIGFVFYAFYRLAPVFIDAGNFIRNFFRA